MTPAPNDPGSDPSGDPTHAPDRVTFSATYFDGLSSRAHPARVWPDGADLVVELGSTERRVPAASVRLDPPLSTSPRTLHLPGGARLVSGDLAAVARWERHLGRNPVLRLVSGLEARWPMALAALAGVLLFAALFLRFGLPWLALLGAELTPGAELRSLDQQTYDTVSRLYLKPSGLPPARQRQLQQEFLTQVVGPDDGPYTFRLLLRQSGDIGPNAFALPGGTVVMTDDLVRLARNDRELLGVLAHEVGHVRHRHAMQQVYQGVGVTLLLAAVAGDVTGLTSVAAALPAVLLQSGYSRAAETQADDDAGHWLMREYGTTRPLRDLLTRLSEDEEGHGGGMDLLESHPGTPQRLAHLKAIEAAGR